MSQQFAFAGGNAKSQGHKSAMEKAGLANIQPTLIDLLKALFPVKTWASVSRLLHVDEAVAKHRLAGTRKFTADEVAELLRSEQGIHVLVAIMDDARPEWWKTFLRMGILGGIERRREADKNLLRKIAHVTDQTAAELPAALMVQDSEFFSPVFEALDAVARRPDRAVGQAPDRKMKP